LQTGIRAIGDTETLEKVIDPQARVSIRRQCELLDVNRSNVYYQPVPEDPEDLELMRRMDEEFLKRPTKGVLGMVDFIRGLGILVGPKRVRRLLRKMGIMAIYNTAVNSDHRVSLTKTIKFTHYVNNKKETQCRLQGPSGYRGNQGTGDLKRTGQAI